MNTALQHARGCIVGYNDKTYLVSDCEESKQEVLIQSLSSKDKRWVKCSDVSCGFRRGMAVKHIPHSSVHPSLGVGTVHQSRCIGGSPQVLVEFHERNQRLWLPYERLAFFKDPSLLFSRGIFKAEAEEFQLRCLAYALELWNENTGSLSHFEIDPLPHQIHLVYHILASGNLNWLIADDVGLGKTIEVGLLLSALKQRKQLRSVLLVTPAGLTRQWREEMSNRFRINDFRIYGENFQIESVEDWRRFPYVIASIDRLKQDAGLQNILMSEGWDLVIFDEAHRLTRNEYGRQYKASQRFKLGAILRQKTENMFLLTATPHQGKQDQFQALLELVRPEWKKEFRKLALHPELLRHFVIRNDKADVTDADGNFIFKGKNIKTLDVPEDPKANGFDKELKKYLQKGYRASSAQGHAGNAIGFVMTVYRKLASSSAAAIHTALLRRLDRLDGKGKSKLFIDDERFITENDEFQETQAVEFFDGEREQLVELIKLADELKKDDQKIEMLLSDVLPSLLSDTPEKKILIFSEYRTTQEYLKEKLNEKYGKDACALIHGSMDYKEREREIARFEDECSFMISTEAGGEGINLQKKCNLLINYDLPWNPSRLLQRIGRLYRYGQEQVVFILNISSQNSFDGKLVGILYERIDQVVQDMQAIGPEFKDGFEEELLGSFIKAEELNSILENAFSEGIERTEERIAKALEKALQAAEKQKDLFSYAQAYDPDAMRHELRLGTSHLRHFAKKMFIQEGIDIVSERKNGAIFSIKLPEELAENIGYRRRRLEVTFDRSLARGRDNLVMLDIESPLMRYLLNKAKDSRFGGLSAGIKSKTNVMMATILRWQDAQGRRMRQEFSLVDVKDDETVINPESFQDFLISEVQSDVKNIDKTQTKLKAQLISKALDERLASQKNENLHPESIQWIAGAWGE